MHASESLKNEKHLSHSNKVSISTNFNHTWGNQFFNVIGVKVSPTASYQLFYVSTRAFIGCKVLWMG